MKLGIISGQSAEDFAYVQSLGLREVEFCINVGNDAKAIAATTPEIKQNCVTYDIHVASIGRWGTKRLNDDGSFGEEYEQDLALIDMCAALDCPVFVCGCSGGDNLNYNEKIQCAIAYMKALTAYGEQKGVGIAVYNCDWSNFIYDKRAWDLVLPAVPGLGIKYDTSHCINRDGDYLREMLDYGKYIKHFHLKGTVRVGDQNISDPPAGMDDIAWGSVFAILYEHEYDGVLSIEPHSARWSHGKRGAWGVRFTLEYFKKYIFEDDGEDAPKQFMP
ncbi:MAG: sugar phosphate isomerase/epimerase [Oscillospiraceae bacterium]|jgi:sugar phosphate isomerase/epimerase|nr:sugar phosphate isomerase/epimerase [Oscillospiraceae bacterium]